MVTFLNHICILLFARHVDIVKLCSVDCCKSTIRKVSEMYLTDHIYYHVAMKICNDKRLTNAKAHRSIQTFSMYRRARVAHARHDNETRMVITMQSTNSYSVVYEKLYDFNIIAFLNLLRSYGRDTTTVRNTIVQNTSNPMHRKLVMNYFSLCILFV